MCRGKAKNSGVIDFLEENFLYVSDSEGIDEQTDEDFVDDEVARSQASGANSAAAVATTFFLMFLFISEMFLIIFYYLPALSINTNQVIAHRLCKVFSKLKLGENMTDSWCTPGVFNMEFRLEVQCPCFLPKISQNYSE